MPPKTVLWERKAHTEGKHRVLESYLQAWFPIMGKDVGQRLFFVDGFAGPGEYADGKEGSPALAMRVLSRHPARSKVHANVGFFFIEEDRKRFQHLAGVVAKWNTQLPHSAQARSIPGSFASSMEELIDREMTHGRQLPPSLVVVDPFGFKGAPLKVIGRVLRNPGCEAYVTFMWEAISRHVKTDEFALHLDEYYGTKAWREARTLDGSDKKEFLYDLYRRQLKRAGARHVVYFHLFHGNRHKYSIFFGTGHPTGLDRMKKAIWGIAPFGDYSFRSSERGQTVYLGVADFEPLRRALQDRFCDKGWVSIEQLLEFVRSDRTIYHDGQVKGVRAPGVLKPMEREGLLHVDPESRRKSFTYPPGCRLKFHARTPRLL